MDYTIKTYLERENARTMLRVNNLKLSNAGSYTVKVTNGELTKMENFTLIVRSAPVVEVSVLNPQGLYNKGHEYTLKCSADGFPMPKIEWLFKPCKDFEECDNGRTVYLGDLIQKRHKNQNTYSSVSMIREVARRSGQIICQACNTIRCVYNSVDFFVTDVPDGGFSVNGPENVLVGEAIKLKCSASKYNFTSEEMDWYKDSLSGLRKLESNNRHTIDVRNTDFSFSKELRIHNVSLSDKGRYICRVNKKEKPQVSASRRRSHYNAIEDDNKEELSFKLNVLPLEPPVFIDTNLLPTYGRSTPAKIVERPEDGIELFCRVAGRPWPSINWYLNGAKLYPTVNNSRIQILNNNQVVSISYFSPKDEGLYECKAQNRVGTIEVIHMVQLRSTADRETLYAHISIPVIVAVVIALLLVIVLIVIAKICYSKNRSKTSSISTASCHPWKDPPTPPTPKLTQFELPLATPPSNQEEEDYRVTLTHQDSGSVSFDSLRRNGTPHPPLQHPCCNTIYSHCHYQHVPQVHEPLLAPAPPSQCPGSICECSLQTIPQGTLERQFPHLYSHHATLMRNGHNPIYNDPMRRSHSVSPSRRSAEY